MEFEDVSRVCDKFCKLLKFSFSEHFITCAQSSSLCEIQVCDKQKTLLCSVVVSTQSITVLFTGDFDERKFYSLDCSSSVMLLYYLSVICYSQLVETGSYEFSYLQFLSVLLLETVENWKSLFTSLCRNLKVGYKEEGDRFLVGDYDVYCKDNMLFFENVAIDFEPNSLSSFVEGVFNVVEYIAVLVSKQDDLYKFIDITKSDKPDEWTLPDATTDGVFGESPSDFDGFDDFGGDDFEMPGGEDEDVGEFMDGLIEEDAADVE